MERCLSTYMKEHLPKWLLKLEDIVQEISIKKLFLSHTEHSANPEKPIKILNKQTGRGILKYAGAYAI